MREEIIMKSNRHKQKAHMNDIKKKKSRSHLKNAVWYGIVWCARERSEKMERNQQQRLWSVLGEKVNGEGCSFGEFVY